jgi:hypothetical protein
MHALVSVLRFLTYGRFGTQWCLGQAADDLLLLVENYLQASLWRQHLSEAASQAQGYSVNKQLSVDFYGESRIAPTKSITEKMQEVDFCCSTT